MVGKNRTHVHHHCCRDAEIVWKMLRCHDVNFSGLIEYVHVVICDYCCWFSTISGGQNPLGLRRQVVQFERPVGRIRVCVVGRLGGQAWNVASVPFPCKGNTLFDLLRYELDSERLGGPKWGIWVQSLNCCYFGALLLFRVPMYRLADEISYAQWSFLVHKFLFFGFSITVFWPNGSPGTDFYYQIDPFPFVGQPKCRKFT